MEIQDTRPYVTAMEQIKRRVDLIYACVHGRVEISGPPRVELATLQLRMVLETIALASLSAHKELFEQQSLNFKKHWHPSEIIRDLHKLNPRFFPRPIRETESGPDRVSAHEPIAEGFLTQEELVEVHGRCGDLLHARNPFRPAIEYGTFLDNVLNWTNRAIRLLNTHEIRLIGDEHFYLVHMSEIGSDAVRMYTFSIVPG